MEVSTILQKSKKRIQKSTENNNLNTFKLANRINIKRFVKNPIGNDDLFSSQVKNLKTNNEIPRNEQNELTLLKKGEHENAIKHLKKLQPNLNFCLEAEVNSIQEPFYMVSAMVANRKFFGHGKQIHLAESDAAIQILYFMDNNKNDSMNYIKPSSFHLSNHNCQQMVLYKELDNGVFSSLEMSSYYADIVEAKVMHAFNKLTNRDNECNNYKVLAGIVMTVNMDFGSSQVISVATGTKCINGGNICCNGSVLNDSHAEIVAKRGLVKFLFTQLRNHCSIDTAEKSVFLRTATGYRLKSFVHFHLYINTAPCGDARVFNFNNNLRMNNSFQISFNSLLHGQLRTKVEGETGTAPIGSRFYPQTWDGVVLGEPLLTMSCSDKIALWNVVGIQGALLSNFVEPIYLHSITLGSQFNAQHLYHAVCGRIQGTLGHLPQSFRLNRPLLGQTSKPLRRYTYPVPIIGINWTWGDNDIEIISMRTGRCIDNAISFLSKQAFFFKYYFLCNNLPNLGYCSGNNIYAEAKKNSRDYQSAKSEVFEAFHRANLGNWVKKPKEQNEFTMNLN